MLLVLLAAAASAAYAAPYATDFESDAPGSTPPGWTSATSIYCAERSANLQNPLSFDSTSMTISGGKGAAGTTQSLMVRRAPACLLSSQLSATKTISSDSLAIHHATFFIAIAASSPTEGTTFAKVRLLDNASHEVAHASLLYSLACDSACSLGWRVTSNGTATARDHEFIPAAFVKVSFSAIDFANDTLSVSFDDGPPMPLRMSSTLVNGFSVLEVLADGNSQAWIDQIDIG